MEFFLCGRAGAEWESWEDQLVAPLLGVVFRPQPATGHFGGVAWLLSLASCTRPDWEGA